MVRSLLRTSLASSEQYSSISVRVSLPFSRSFVRAVIALSGISFSESSLATPSTPILSSLSKVTETVSRASSGKPIVKREFLKTRLSFTLTVNSPIPIFVKAFPVTEISSISLQIESEPKMSMSHCTNSRSLPLWGLSAR